MKIEQSQQKDKNKPYRLFEDYFICNSRRINMTSVPIVSQISRPTFS